VGGLITKGLAGLPINDSAVVPFPSPLYFPTLLTCRCKNPRLSAAFNLAGKSPKSPALENPAPERVDFQAPLRLSNRQSSRENGGKAAQHGDGRCGRERLEELEVA